MSNWRPTIWLLALAFCVAFWWEVWLLVRWVYF